MIFSLNTQPGIKYEEEIELKIGSRATQFYKLSLIIIFMVILVCQTPYYIPYSVTKGAQGTDNIEWRQKNFTINQNIDLSTNQVTIDHFPLYLDWVGTHARVRITGGIISGQIPNNLRILVILDDIETQTIFYKNDGLKYQYTFHSSSEYIVAIPPPVRPALDRIQTLHNFTIAIKFEFNSSPQGNAIINQIIFETFTPSILDPSCYKPIFPLNEKFSWKIDKWFFGTYICNTYLFLPLSEFRNISLLINIEFERLVPDNWQIIIEQGETSFFIRDQLELTGMLEINPFSLCKLILMVDPPKLTEIDILNVNIDVQGKIVLPKQTSPTKPDFFLLASEKRITEGLALLNLGLLVVPIITFYRLRCPKFKNFRKEEK